MKIDKQLTAIHPLQTESYNKYKTTAMEVMEKEPIALHDNQVIRKNDLETAISKFNELMEPLRTDIQFKLHEKLNEYYVTVVNPETNQTIREIPPKKMLDMYAAMAEFMGLLVDEKV